VPSSPSESSPKYNIEEIKKQGTDSYAVGPFKNAPVGFQFSFDLGDEPDEDDDEINNTDGEEEGEEE